MPKKIENITLFILIPFLGFIFDFITKQSIIYNICHTGKSYEILPFFQLVCTLNTGVSFGMFSEIPYGKEILTIITIIILLFIYVLMYKEKSRKIKYCYSLIISGAFGNIIDRILHGGVIDFLDFYYKNSHYPAFNVADSLIFIGVFGIITLQIQER